MARRASGAIYASSENRVSGHPVISATIATVVGGLIVTGILAVLHRPNPVKPTPSPITTSSSSPSGSHGSSSPSRTQGSSIAPGTELFSGKVSIPAGDNLQYSTGAGEEVVFSYYNALGYLAAGSGGSLSVLNAPMPASNAAYQACQSSSNRTSQVALNALTPGDTICGFTANNEVSWVRFLGVTNGQTSFDTVLHVDAVAFQGPHV